MRALLAVVLVLAVPWSAEAQRAVIAELEQGYVEIVADGVHAEGLVVGDERWIVTTLCAVQDELRAHGWAARVEVHFASSTTRHARVARIDAGHDLALLVVEDGAVPVSALPLSATPVDVGRVVFAYGSAPGLPGSLLHATVVGRRAGTADHAPDVPDLIQTEGLLGPAAGSPIVDVGGRVVGMWLTREGANPRFGVSIPIERVLAFLDAVRASRPRGSPTLAELGITVEDGVDGVLVSHVEPGSPAERAGLGGTDAPMRTSPLRIGIPLGVVITELAGTRVRTVLELEAALGACRRGLPIGITVRRGQATGTWSARTTVVLDAAL